MDAPTVEAQIQALDRGEGLVDLEGWILVEVAGDEAVGWLNDLVTADVAALVPGATVRSLLLGPTGRIRADLLVHRREDAPLLLLQGPDQPRPIDELLAPYVLSSPVELSRSTARPAVRPDASGGASVVIGAVDGTPVGAQALESWRIRAGLPRFPVDLDEDSLPAEAGLDTSPVIDRAKGCYLGQEAVAKVRNLGHPTRVVLALRAFRFVTARSELFADGERVGTLTSVDALGGGTAAIARIRWEAREAELSTPDGIALTRR